MTVIELLYCVSVWVLGWVYTAMANRYGQVKTSVQEPAGRTVNL